MKRLALFLLIACGKVPETGYYQLATPAAASARGDLTIVLEPLETDEGYNDERIVYRTSPYRFDYYNYHRWSASPGIVVGNYLEQALEKSGHFKSVIRELVDGAPVVLGGRVVAIEEVDDSRAKWKGRLVVELSLRDAKSNEVLWSEQFEELEPMQRQNPEGLAYALSTAMSRIVKRAAPAIADVAAQRLHTVAERR